MSDELSNAPQNESAQNDATQNDAGKQGRSASTQTRVGAPTNEILNTDGIAIAWDVIEETSRRIGIAAACIELKIKPSAAYARSKSHKWKKIPDARSLTKTDKGSGMELQTMEGDLSGVIDRHRATVYQKTSASIKKFRPKAPRTFREFDAADKIARRALGIDDERPILQQTLIKINEAIAEHEAIPVEAHVIPCDPEPAQPLSIDEGEQGSNEQPAANHTPPKESDDQKESVTSTSLTLNPNDKSARRFVLPGVIRTP